MAQATLDAPLTLDPTQAVKLKIMSFNTECDARVVTIRFAMLDASGKVVSERTVQADGAQVQTWITNQETTIYNRLLAKLGVTGTIA
jgi:hypothetical protein